MEKSKFNNDYFPESSKKKKKIRYTQKNVIDFAWFADKRYNVLKGEVKLPNSEKKVTTWSMFTDKYAKSFQNSIQYIDSSIYYYSKLVGEYPYNQATALTGPMGAGGGMEYPTITIISISGNPRDIILHEVGHNWFQAILATNERRFSWMDEGINSFYENRITNILDGNKDFEKNNNRNIFKTKKLSDKKNNEMKWIYCLSASKENDQPANLTSEDFITLNYGVVVYGKAAYIFDHLIRYLGAKKFDEIMKKYYEEWKFKHPYPEDLHKIFYEETGDSLNWFFKDLLQTHKKNDYAIMKVKNKNDSVYVDLKNKGKINAPLTIGYLTDNKEYTYKWIEGFAGNKTFVLPKTETNKIAINGDNSLFDINTKNNYKENNKPVPVKLKLGYDLKNLHKREILYIPAIAYNKPDGFMLGFGFYNMILPVRNFEFSLFSFYGFGSNKFAYSGDFRYNIYPYSEKNYYRIQIGLKSKKYSLDKNAGYLKLEPHVSLSFKKRPLRNYHNHSLKFRSVNIFISEKKNDYFKEENHEKINEFSYKYNYSKLLHQKSFDVKLQMNEYFTKIFMEYKMAIPYYYKNSKLDLRFFAGKFLENSLQIGKEHYFGLSGRNGFANDYMFDYTYFHRAGTTTWKSRQIYENNGYLKMSNNIGENNDWLIAVNLKSSLYGNWPVKAFFDIGTYNDAKKSFAGSQQFVYTGGLMLNFLDDIFEIYFPFIYSQDVKQNINDNDIPYKKQIMFTINLHKYDIFEFIKYLGDTL